MISTAPFFWFLYPFGPKGYNLAYSVRGSHRSCQSRPLSIKAAGLEHVAIADIAKVPRRCADSNRGMETAGAVVQALQGFGEHQGRDSAFSRVGTRAGRAHIMYKIILADSQAIFRAGTAKVLAMDEDLRIIAQCTDLERMYHAVTTFPNSIVLFAASLQPDFTRLGMLLETTNSRGIVIAENNEAAAAYLQQGFRGVVFRNVTGPALVECVRRVAAGDSWLPTQAAPPEAIEEDLVGARVRDRLTPKEMRIVALIVQGCKNREIAIRLKTTE